MALHMPYYSGSPCVETPNALQLFHVLLQQQGRLSMPTAGCVRGCPKRQTKTQQFHHGPSCEGQCLSCSACHDSSRTMTSMLCVSSDTLLLLPMGGEDAVVSSLHSCLGVYEVSIVCITLHPLLSRLVHLLLTFSIAPHLKNSHWVGKPID